MRHRVIWLTIFFVTSTIVFLGGVIFVLLFQIPDIYQELQIPEGSIRKDQSGQMIAKITNLFNELKNNEQKWGLRCSIDQLNSYIQEDFMQSIGSGSDLPKKVNDIRVSIGDDIYVGFRYQSFCGEVIVSIQFRVWLVAHETNTICLELIQLKAGSIPLSPHLLLDFITESAHQANMGISWYRHKGNPVALLKYQADQLLPTMIIDCLRAENGELLISGRSTEVDEVTKSNP